MQEQCVCWSAGTQVKCSFFCSVREFGTSLAIKDLKSENNSLLPRLINTKLWVWLWLKTALFGGGPLIRCLRFEPKKDTGPLVLFEVGLRGPHEQPLQKTDNIYAWVKPEVEAAATAAVWLTSASILWSAKEYCVTLWTFSRNDCQTQASTQQSASQHLKKTHLTRITPPVEKRSC